MLLCLKNTLTKREKNSNLFFCARIEILDDGNIDIVNGKIEVELFGAKKRDCFQW